MDLDRAIKAAAEAMDEWLPAQGGQYHDYWVHQLATMAVEAATPHLFDLGGCDQIEETLSAAEYEVAFRSAVLKDMPEGTEDVEKYLRQRRRDHLDWGDVEAIEAIWASKLRASETRRHLERRLADRLAWALEDAYDGVSYDQARYEALAAWKEARRG